MLVSPLACQKQTWAHPVVRLVVVDSVPVQSGRLTHGMTARMP
jgi:hypothetical protein